MSAGAVWTAARAAIRRRWWQTLAIGFVVLFSTVTVVLGAALLLAASGPFDRAFEAQRGAHVVVAFDAAASPAELAATAHRPGVDAAAGPFGQVALQIPHDWYGTAAGPLVVVGRADPAGPVDRVELRAGRWATGPGEIVINVDYGGLNGTPTGLGQPLETDGRPPLTIVGYATSMSQTAGGWVTPAQAEAWHPTAWQMLYRFTDAGSDEQLRRSVAAATDGLPVASAQSYLAIKQVFAGHVRTLLPILTAFGALGLAISVLLTANIVTGAVVAGYRHIGVLKALGFTARQVVAVYLAMIGIPALAGALAGTLVAVPLAGVTLKVAFAGVPVGTAAIATSPWAPAAGLIGMLAVVALTALIPAVRAGRLPAARAISAGTAPRAGRGLRTQRMLAGARLPRSMSLGLGLPAARPARTALTLAAIVLGVATATLSVGLTGTVTRLSNANADFRVLVSVGTTQNGRQAPARDPGPLLRSLPGAREVVGRAFFQARIAGSSNPVYANFYTGAEGTDAAVIVAGRPLSGPLEAEAGRAFLDLHGLKVGDRMTLAAGHRQATFTIVARTMDDNPDSVDATWDGAGALVPGTTPLEYRVSLADGTDTGAYIAAVRNADPSLQVETTGGGSALTYGIQTFAIVFTCFLVVVAAVGVLNTVLLTSRERRRDLGVLKSIGMTPRQVVAMTVASVATLGVAGGLLGVPIGVAAHRLILDNLGTVDLPAAMKDVWSLPLLAQLALAGVMIAVLGALPPARSAARLPVAAVLHTE